MPHMKEDNKFLGDACVNGHGRLRYKKGGACVSCASQKSRAAWASGKKRPSKYDPEYRRSRNLIVHYGLTIAQYDKMLADQDGLCMICGSLPTGRSGRFHVDHDHKTGEIRALLCGLCNVGLGSFRDDPKLLEAAALYLECRA